jgi:hypothetical protein
MKAMDIRLVQRDRYSAGEQGSGFRVRKDRYGTRTPQPTYTASAPAPHGRVPVPRRARVGRQSLLIVNLSAI